MSLGGWLVFASFWAVFVTTPGPNAVNCVETAMRTGFRPALWCVAAILTQASLFLALSAFGVTALISSFPEAFFWMRLGGAAVLVWLGVRGWMAAHRPPRVARGRGSIYFRALLIATVNAKSLAGYLAAFSQFVEPGVPLGRQMIVIVPTALSLTALSYTGYVWLGARLGRAALGALFSLWLRRTLSGLFVVYGIALGAATGRAA